MFQNQIEVVVVEHCQCMNVTEMVFCYVYFTSVSCGGGEQWWVKLSEPYHKSRQQHQNVPILVLFTAKHSLKKLLTLLNLILEYITSFLCGKIGYRHKELPMCTQEGWLSQGKPRVGMLKPITQVSHFFCETHFYLK